MSGGICERAHARNSALLVLLHHFVFDMPDGATVREIARAITDNPVSVRPEETSAFLEPFIKPIRALLEKGGTPLDFVISNQSWKMDYDRDGLNACTFTDPATDEVYFTFRGTGDGEWDDNGAALCGVRQTNVYYAYNDSDIAVSAAIREDLLSTQQAQTLDYVERALLRGGWKNRRSLIAAGHSKGGNKAQLAALFYSEFAEGYSFNGQGFSPEAVEWFKDRFSDYGERVKRVFSICCCDDFVSGLGDMIYPAENLVTVGRNAIKSLRDCHELHTMISDDLEFNAPTPRSRLGMSTVKLWEAVRESPDRKLAAMGLMNICEKQYGSGLPVNGEYVTGGVEAIGSLISAGLYIKANTENVKPIARAVSGVGALLEKLYAAAEPLGLSRERLRADFESQLASSPHAAATLKIKELAARADALDAAAKALDDTASALESDAKTASDLKIAVTSAERLLVIAATLRNAISDFEGADAALAALARLTLMK